MEMKSFLEQHNNKRKAAYHACPRDLKEHHGIEQTVLAGGYGYRQIMELVQNGADAIIEAHENNSASIDSRIHVLLRDSYLYVANTGAPLSEEGIEALLSSHSSPKRGNQIGRFGLGFKSLLRLNGRIDVFTSVSGAIRFEPERCRDELRQEFNVTDAPGLRLAWPLKESERKRDDVLRSLAWAETIVRVDVREDETRGHLQVEIGEFPAEFLLFFPLPTKLVLDDGEKPSREIRIELDDEDHVLHDGAESSKWRIAKRTVTIIDQRARDDATHIHSRDTTPLAWAIPLDGRREEAGRFWAFFPTQTPTHLSGIINAPWKLNSDRNAVIPGDWNIALMSEAARLVAETLPTLSSKDDPARHIDSFPRQLDRQDEVAAPLVKAMWEVIKHSAIVPDATGKLRHPHELYRHPLDIKELARYWTKLATSLARTQLVHSSCLDQQRNGRLSELAKRLSIPSGLGASVPGLRKYTPDSWFKAVASSDPKRAIQVLQLAENYYSQCNSPDWNQVRPQLAIIVSQDNRLLTSEQSVMVPDGMRVPFGRYSVAKALTDDEKASHILVNVMKVKSLDESVWIAALNDHLQKGAWLRFWEQLRSAPDPVRRIIISRYGSAIRVRRSDGAWTPSDEALLPGSLVAADDSNNQRFLVDLKFHVGDGAILEALGVRAFPEPQLASVPCDHPGLDEWETYWSNRCYQSMKGRPQRDHLGPLENFVRCLKGWYLLTQLNGTSNCKLTQHYLDFMGRDGFTTPVLFGHDTRSDYYGTIEASNPMLWLLNHYGTVQIGKDCVRLAAIAVRIHVNWVKEATGWKDHSALMRTLSETRPNDGVTKLDIHAVWKSVASALATPETLSGDSLSGLWSDAAKDDFIPDRLYSKSGAIELSQVFVTGSPHLARHARKGTERVVVSLDDETREKWLTQGAQDLFKLIKPQWSTQTGPLGQLVSVLPEIAPVLRQQLHDSAQCQPVAGLKLQIAERAQPVPCLMWDNTLFVELEQLRALSRNKRLESVLAEIAAANWIEVSVTEAMQILGNTQVDQLRAKVKGEKESSLAERLLRAVGGRLESLRTGLGEMAEAKFVRNCKPMEISGLVLARLGPAVLLVLKPILDEEGLMPPARWNSAAAREFVTSIGFPQEFAASAESRRESEEFISGPIMLRPLHDFQQEVFDGLEKLFAKSTGRRRAVINLPTGGGKTRVTVEAAVKLVLRPESTSRSVIWVAQTDELCEQAVQAFRQVWLNHGAQSTELRIVRLWGGNPTPILQDPSRPVVVVSSIQTLNYRMGTDGMTWLRHPGLVVVDECHHAITPSYTNLLRWLDSTTTKPSGSKSSEPPILGLSATPFRKDDDESKRLAKRFDNLWLPKDQEELHARLQSQGVLATAVHESMDSGVGILAHEVDRLAEFPSWEGLQFDIFVEAFNKRLAANEQRNQLIIKRVKEAEEHSILLFANSVQHAEELAARLHLEGIAAAAISGDTPASARRYFLGRFQCGDVRVLCNHSVLSTGFDAPKTEMVFIARQVFSAVRYMQMVGRGLRGVENGGTSRCRILTVLDNLGRFQDRHPYHYCKHNFG